MTFRITIHSGAAAPVDAIELLARQLGAKRDEATFTRASWNEIRVTWGEREASAASRHLRIEVERQAVLDLVCDVCERAPKLKSDWFAVGPLD